ncbi:MAG: helix-turn-helix domain-containing protein [Novosphingobium sp.]|nr:helix-turn-helix domain-containing protein [Novosphingobium sp.]
MAFSGLIPLLPAVFRDGLHKEATVKLKPIAASPKDAFAAIGVGVTKGYELINSGELETFKIGRATRITTASIEAYVARRLAEKSEAA